MTPALLLGMAALSGTVVAVAAWLMLRTSDRDLEFATRIGAARGTWVRVDETAEAVRSRRLVDPVQQCISALGMALMQSGLLPGRTRAELQQALISSGFRGPNALALFIGAKLVLIVAGPIAGVLLAGLMGSPNHTFYILGGFIGGLLLPDQMIKRFRKSYLSKLEAGLPDALDLLVICAQAGLSLEPAMSRVAAEMRGARPQVAVELELTVRELEIMGDAAVALGNLGKRTGLSTLQRLVSTLVQTMQYGTPLTDALRNLSAEVRQQTLTHFEAQAARLPVLLTLPMVLFIMPCVFIVVGGPAILQVMKTFGG